MADESSNKKEIEQLRNSEKKYQSYIEKRNELNNLSRVLREERDMINEKHKELRETINKLKLERDDLVTKMREHKEMRNRLQEQAKKLIDDKQKKRGKVFKNLPLRVEELKADFQMLEYRQETVPMNPSEENELIESIRLKRKEYKDTKKQLEKQKLIEIDISDKDNVITELFKKADEEHEMVQKYYNENQKKHNEYIKLIRELSISINEANKKHEQYIEVKEEAQRNHEKAVEMRSKIIAVKGERRKRWEDAKKAIQEQNVKARKAVMDKNKLEEHANRSVVDLKKGKKITL
jgi:uncharacterized coiled-coil DUF342 family protein